jgi:NADH-quinone oxidoreductase subunit C
VGEVHLDAKDPWVDIDAAAVREVCLYLRDDPELRFEALSNLSGVDYKDDGKIELVYHLFSYAHRQMFVLKCRTPRDAAEVPSVEPVWKAANWLEREIYDLLGVTFTDHTDLRRLLMPEDWIGYPLRKDFVEPDEYHGISTRRESLLR